MNLKVLNFMVLAYHTMTSMGLRTLCVNGIIEDLASLRHSGTLLKMKLCGLLIISVKIVMSVLVVLQSLSGSRILH
jgi:hypothetical protein